MDENKREYGPDFDGDGAYDDDIKMEKDLDIEVEDGSANDARCV